MSVFNVWDPLTIFWAPPKGLDHFSGFTFCSHHRMSPKLRLVRVHGCCYSWWSSRGTISKMLRSLRVTDGLSPVAYPGFSSWGQASAALLDPSFFQTITTWCLTVPSLMARLKYNFSHLWKIASACWLIGNTSKMTSLQWCWSLLNHWQFFSSSWPV